MTTTRRFLWGGIGGLAPILATFLILEADIIGRYLSELGQGGSAMTVIGYVVRVIGLFIVGGLWASLHKSERDPKKLFQLGIVAPAMITGMISASNINAESMPAAEDVAMARPPAVAAAPDAAATARAPGSPRSLMANRDQPQTDRPPPEPEPVKSFIRGLLGRP